MVCVGAHLSSLTEKVRILTLQGSDSDSQKEATSQKEAINKLRVQMMYDEREIWRGKGKGG